MRKGLVERNIYRYADGRWEVRLMVNGVRSQSLFAASTPIEQVREWCNGERARLQDLAVGRGEFPRSVHAPAKTIDMHEVVGDVTQGPPATTALATSLARAAAGELLGPQDMMAIFNLRSSAYYRRKTRGEFDLFLTRPPIGTHRYSGVLVHRYLRGEPVYEPTFGRRPHKAGRS